MTAIVDYGVGNLFSLQSSLRFLGLEAEVTCAAERLRAAERIILPGVGAFGDARAKLDATGLVPVLLEEAERKPLLGQNHHRRSPPRQAPAGHLPGDAAAV